MNITVEDVAPCKKRLKIEVPANRVKQAYDKVADDFQKQARIPGFRPGQCAPHGGVVKKFHKEIEGEAQRSLVPEAYQEAIKEKEAARGQPAGDRGLEISARPLPQFFHRGGTGARIQDCPNTRASLFKKQETEVTDEEVDKTLTSLADQRASFDDAPERPAGHGRFRRHFLHRQAGRRSRCSTLVPEAKNLAVEPQFLALDEGRRLPAEVRRAAA